MVPTDQVLLAADITNARFAIWAAFVGARPRRRTADLAVDAALVARAAVPVARARGGAASAIHTLLGAGAARAAAARGGAGARAKDADQVAGAAATVAVDAATIRATGAAIALRDAPGRWFGRRLLRLLLFLLLLFLLALAPGLGVVGLGQP